MDPIARIIDANANRAREALRVMEDIARFGLNSQALSVQLKTLRHNVQQAVNDLPFDDLSLLASRDIDRDVGATITDPREEARSGLDDIAAAAAGRLSEALRSMEEASKVVLGNGGQRFESLRYQAYALDKRLRLALGGARGLQWRLCVLITESLCAEPWEHVAKSALAGGADCLQLREKSLDSAELLRRARRLVEIAHDVGAAAIINDRPDIALLAGADGVHVGQTDLSVADVRALAGRRLLVGVSTHRIDQARQAHRDGADYCGLGPMFPTTTKDAGGLAGPRYLRAYLALGRTLSHLAIGGVTAENVGALVSEGCKGVAVSSFVCGSSDPRGATEQLLAAMDAAAVTPRASAGAD